MTDMIACPVDGCDYTGLRKSVLGHYSGKRDEAHKGGREKAKMLLDDSGQDSEPEHSPEQSPAESSDSGGESQPSEQSGSNPAMDSPPVQERTRDESEPVCPDCGSDEYAVIDELDGVPEQYQTYDYVCPRCKEVWNG